ncbi:uncharacterized protein LOC128715104 [Anopheles marshallii]|uniref:uncharacterized protein LOC128715104 n=1 Tax=Anopheles marshallii TaxID=1521116 RepID=UPI00237A2E8B|nr:uncharacterized protein LOC128715104 [Anopheles marshallii]
MDCCSSSSYVDYRHHSMNGNFCYPYSPNMLRSASPYPLASAGRYGADYRSSPLGYHHHGGYDGYEKYYGSYHHASSSYQTGYYGNYPSSYRDYGSYGHYYHQSQSPYARGGSSGGGAPPGYGASATGAGYLYPGRHYPASSSTLAHPFGARESSYYHAQREHHQQQQYSSFASYGHLPPYRNGVGPGTHEHPGGKSHHHPQQPTHQQPYPPQQTFAGSHNERGMTGSVGSEGGTTSASHPSPPSASTLFSAQNGYSSPSSDYTLPTSAYSSADSPQHPLADEGDALTPTATPTPSTALLGATAAEYPHGTKDNRMRKPKERKLHRAYGGGNGNGSGRGSRASSPAAAAANGLSGSNGAAAATRMKSLDALTNLCWPEEDQFSGRMRKYSTANGLKSKEGNNGRKESNELETATVASPSRTTGPGRRTKKQTPTSRQAKETKLSAESREKQTNRSTPPTPTVENKNITPLPGFQQAFGSTEIGKFSEVFFNSSPTSANHSPPQHHHQHHHNHPLQLQDHQPQNPQSQQVPAQSHGTMQQLVMESLNAYESDVDTLSPCQAWDTSGPGVGDTYENTGTTGSGYNPQIGTSFHPSYYESSSYSDHGVDSPLGNYFSEMTCNEFVN